MGCGPRHPCVGSEGPSVKAKLFDDDCEEFHRPWRAAARPERAANRASDRGPVRTRSTDEVNQFLDQHIVESTNMQCLTPPRPSPIARIALGLRNEPVTPVDDCEEFHRHSRAAGRAERAANLLFDLETTNAENLAVTRPSWKKKFLRARIAELEAQLANRLTPVDEVRWHTWRWETG